MVKAVVDCAVFRTKRTGVSADVKMERQSDAQGGRLEAFGCAGDDVFRGAGLNERDVEWVLGGPALEDSKVFGPITASKAASDFDRNSDFNWFPTWTRRCNLVTHVTQGVLKPTFAAFGVVVGGRAAWVKLGAEIDDCFWNSQITRDRLYLCAADDVGVLRGVVVGGRKAREDRVSKSGGFSGGGVGLVDDVVVCFEAIEQIAEAKRDRHLLEETRYLVNFIVLFKIKYFYYVPIIND